MPLVLNQDFAIRPWIVHGLWYRAVAPRLDSKEPSAMKRSRLWN